MAAADARPPLRPGRGSAPFLCRAVSGAQLPTQLPTRFLDSLLLLICSCFRSVAFCCFLLLKKFLATNAVIPPPEVALATSNAVLAKQIGHIRYFAPFCLPAFGVFSKYSANRSSDPSQNFRYSSTHCAAFLNGAASSCISCTRP